MFTGLIEEVGTIVEVEGLDDGRRFRVGAGRTLVDLALGDSIAVDGVCLTITARHADAFDVQSVATTLQRTTLGSVTAGTKVNLERALAIGDRLGGHLVQGHVDGVGEIRSIQPRAGHVLIDFTLPPIVAQVTVPHGSVTLNGISLTVNELKDAGVCQVSIIPHTWQVTNLPDLRVGAAVNLEGDLIGKYVRSLLGAPGDDAAEHLRHHWGY
ncbi:MAG: riboflavin synthase [Gemmatimonas sp.]|nr:riboflavin synthase [Gemmatimonas sp.]